MDDDRQFHVTLVVRGVVTASSAIDALRQFRTDALSPGMTDSAVRRAQVSLLAEGQEYCESASTAWPPSPVNGMMGTDHPFAAPAEPCPCTGGV